MTHRTDEFKRLAERVVALRLEGLTYEEIARETGARFGTVGRHDAPGYLGLTPVQAFMHFLRTGERFPFR